MASTLNPVLSDFGRASAALDKELIRFERLGHDIEIIDLESDKGFARGIELLTEIAQCRSELDTHMQEMSRALQLARVRNEKAEETISLRARALENRQMEVEKLQGRFKTLGESVHHLNVMVSEFRNPNAELKTKDEQINLHTQLNRAIEPIDVLVEQAKALVQDARSLNMKNLERNADTLRQSLQSAVNRLLLSTKKEKSSALLN